MVDIVRYDNVGDLNRWMKSKERQALLEELDPIVESMHAHRVTGLEAWFALNRAPGATVTVPPSRKQALAVLFALYPTVMALTYLSPLWRNCSLPLQMLFGNILSVALLTWLVMPRVSQFLKFWIAAPVRDWKNEAVGFGTVTVGLALFVLIFKLL